MRFKIRLLNYKILNYSILENSRYVKFFRLNKKDYIFLSIIYHCTIDNLSFKTISFKNWFLQIRKNSKQINQIKTF